MSATYSARDAARRVGLSDAAVRRAIASGHINPAQIDGMWRLTDEDLATLRTLRRSRFDARRRTTDAAATSLRDAPASATPPDALVALVERQQHPLIEMAGRIGFLQACVQDLEQEIRLLKAPTVENLQSPDLAPAPMPNHPAPSANGARIESERPPRRPWWRFWARD